MFERLGVPITFALEPGVIQRAFLARAAAAHPDAGGDDVDEAGDAQGMAELNAARAALADPERRANLVVEALGGPSAAEDKSLPEGYLMDVMDLRQQIEADLTRTAGSRLDAGTGWQELARARRREHERAVGRELDEAARQPEGSQARRAALAAARRELNAWRYTERVMERLDAHESGGPMPR